MIKINQIQIKRFRSINDLTLEIDHTHNISTICGQNNVGKTNILRAINLFFDRVNFDYKEDVPEFKQLTAGASVYPLIKLRFIDDKNSDVYEISKDFDIRELSEDSQDQYTLEGKKNVEVLDLRETSKFLSNLNIFYLPSINISFPETINYLIDDKFLDIEFGDARMSGKKGDIKESLEKARVSLQEILDDLTKSINPNFKEFHESWGIKFIVPQNINRFREILNNEIEFAIIDATQSEIKSKGAGLQRLGHILLNLRIIEKLSSKRKNCILLIDEPDIYLHAGLQKKLNKRLKMIAEKAQIILTTHSSIFIDSYRMKNIFLLKLEVKEKLSVRKGQKGNILSTELVDLKKSDSVYLVKETLGIEDKDNLVIGRKNLLVEGDEDKKYITELVNFFDLPTCNIISSGGVTNFIKYLDYYNSITENEDSAKPIFTVLFDNDIEGREQHDKIKAKTFDKLEVKLVFVIDAHDSKFDIKRKPNIEIEDLIYPELILELANNIFAKKKGFKKILESVFIKKTSNLSLRFNGVLEILETLKNERNPLLGLALSTKDSSFKGGLAGSFNIKGDTNLIEKLNKLDGKYPEVGKFISKLVKM